MAAKKSEFDKVLSAWDVLVIAFGAMIGWGWVVSTGDWITKGGVLGAMLGFVIGGIMVFFVGLTYAELTSAMPQCGGEHVFSFKALGPLGSFICTWAIVLGYVSVVCFEACAMPTIITYLYPDFLQGYMYSVAGFEIYASWLAVAILVAMLITYVNIRGAKTAAMLQTVLTVIIGGVGILLIAASAFTGNMTNLDGQLFMGASTSDMLKGTIAVAVMTPFYFIGFDVIPQAAEEITVSLKKIGRILILSIVLAVAFYALIIGGVGYIMNSSEIALAMKGVGGLVTADAMSIAFGSSTMAKVLIIGGLCGIVTSWNSFMIGGSRAMYSMAESYMIPRVFGVLHKKYKTPVNALLLIGLLSVVAPFFGKKMLVWVVDAGNFGCCLAYCMVAISFVILRKKAPHMARPYKVSHYKLVGALAIIMSGFMVIMYMIPGSPAALVPQEWAMVLIWSILGVIFGMYCKAKYGSRFATHVDVAVEGAETDRDVVFGQAMESAMHNVRAKGPAVYAVRPIDFSFSVTTPLVFGSGKSGTVGTLAKPFGKKALLVADTAVYTGGTFFKRITDSFSNTGVSYAVFAHATGPVRDIVAANGAAMARQEGCDMVIAVGGNDVIDCAKSIAYTLGHTGTDLVAAPLLFVLTTFSCSAAAFRFVLHEYWQRRCKRSV
jgi:amino acid transporter